MGAGTQLAVVGVLVAAAAVYVARATWKAWAGRPSGKGCGSGCGKCVAAPPPEPTRDGRFSLPQL